MQILSQHVRRDQRQSAVGNPETACAISVCIFTNNGAGLDSCTSIDDGAPDRTALPNVYVWKYD